MAYPLRQDGGGAGGLPASLSPGLRARLSHRLAMHWATAPFRMRNAGPLVSFTFDDAPDSAEAVGARLLAEREARGTFYVSAGCLGEQTPHWTVLDADGVARLHAGGHEIACHTFSHRPATELDGPALRDELRRNGDALRAIVPSLPLRNFAYPYGYGNWARKRDLGERFDSSRSIVPGVNAGTVDLQFLRALPLYDGRTPPDAVDRALDETVARNGWLVFYTHDVSARPSPYGCSPGLLGHALDAASRRGVRCLTVEAALNAVGFRSPRPSNGERLGACDIPVD